MGRLMSSPSDRPSVLVLTAVRGASVYRRTTLCFPPPRSEIFFRLAAARCGEIARCVRTVMDGGVIFLAAALVRWWRGVVLSYSRWRGLPGNKNYRAHCHGCLRAPFK